MVIYVYRASFEALYTLLCFESIEFLLCPRGKYLLSYCISFQIIFTQIKIYIIIPSPTYTQKCSLLYCTICNILIFTECLWLLFHDHSQKAYYSIAWKYNLLNQSFFDGPPCCFQVLTITYCFAVNNSVHESFQMCGSNLWNQCAEVELLN